MLTFGSLSEEGRSNGIQGDAIRNITGTVDGDYQIFAPLISGAFQSQITGGAGSGTARAASSGDFVDGFNMDASRIVPTGSENRPKNRLIRIYKRVA